MVFGLINSRKGKRSRRGVVALLVALVLAGFLLVAQTAPQVRDRVDPVRTAMGDSLGSGGKRGIGLWARISGQAAREERIRALETEVFELSRYKAAAFSMAERLETYEDILNLVGEPDMKDVTARVIAESDGPFRLTLLANAGTNSGVEAGAYAVNEGGLVGRVILIGERSSRILLVSDYNSRVPVVGEVSGLRGILRGENNNLGLLVDLPENTDFIEGERMLTSGEGGAFPRGLVVGEARQIDKQWRVRYAMNASRGGYVQILPPNPIEAPDGVMALPELPPAPPPLVPVMPGAETLIPAPAPIAVTQTPRPRPQPRAEEAVPPAQFITPTPPAPVIETPPDPEPVRLPTPTVEPLPATPTP